MKHIAFQSRPIFFFWHILYTDQPTHTNTDNTELETAELTHVAKKCIIVFSTPITDLRIPNPAFNSKANNKPVLHTINTQSELGHTLTQLSRQ